jgi:hypothetical protein
MTSNSTCRYLKYGTVLHDLWQEVLLHQERVGIWP